MLCLEDVLVREKKNTAVAGKPKVAEGDECVQVKRMWQRSLRLGYKYLAIRKRFPACVLLGITFGCSSMPSIAN